MIALRTRVAMSGPPFFIGVAIRRGAPYTLIFDPCRAPRVALQGVITGQELTLLAFSLDVGPLAGLSR